MSHQGEEVPMECPECGAHNSDRALFCSLCHASFNPGERLDPETSSAPAKPSASSPHAKTLRRIRNWLFVLALVALTSLAVWWLIPRGPLTKMDFPGAQLAQLPIPTGSLLIKDLPNPQGEAVCLRATKEGRLATRIRLFLTRMPANQIVDFYEAAMPSKALGTPQWKGETQRFDGEDGPVAMGVWYRRVTVASTDAKPVMGARVTVFADAVKVVTGDYGVDVAAQMRNGYRLIVIEAQGPLLKKVQFKQM